jgi:hypothetical protein
VWTSVSSKRGLSWPFFCASIFLVEILHVILYENELGFLAVPKAFEYEWSWSLPTLHNNNFVVTVDAAYSFGTRLHLWYYYVFFFDRPSFIQLLEEHNP